MTRAPKPSRGNEDAVTSTSAEGDVWYFLKWFTTNKFALMESFLQQLDHAPTRADRRVLKRRYERAAKHAKRAMIVRLVVTVLVLVSLGSSLVTVVVDALEVLPGATGVVNRVKAVATSLGALLIVARFALDRHLARVEIYLLFMGMQIAGRGQPPATEGDAPSAPPPPP